MNPFRHAAIATSCLLAVMLGVLPAHAEPYVPTDDAEVLETLPRVLFFARDRLAESRQQLSEDPTNAALAARLATDYLEIGKRENDPRFYGYARAALRPWWPAEEHARSSKTAVTESEIPTAILKLRAKLKERDHDYAGALADLDQVLKLDPRDVQALIETANLHWVQGDYDTAWSACDRLAEFADPLSVTLCRVPLLAVTGEAQSAYDQLEAVLPEAQADNSDVVQWMLTMQAVIAEALGNDELAGRHFAEALAHQPDDLYLLRAYADFLLDHDRATEVLAITRGHDQDTGVLLRATLAAQQLGDASSVEAWTAQLADRFEEIRLRGGEPHGRYESRFTLKLLNDPDRALQIALDNWRKQKQARDTRNVLEAALAADRPGAAEPVIAFLKQHGTQDATLQKLIDQLEQR